MSLKGDPPTFEISDLRSPRIALQFVLLCLYTQLVMFVAIGLHPADLVDDHMRAAEAVGQVRLRPISRRCIWSPRRRRR